jgi:hypothetical protein
LLFWSDLQKNLIKILYNLRDTKKKKDKKWEGAWTDERALNAPYSFYTRG